LGWKLGVGSSGHKVLALIIETVHSWYVTYDWAICWYIP
jgi:hypothetical protein